MEQPSLQNAGLTESDVKQQEKLFLLSFPWVIFFYFIFFDVVFFIALEKYYVLLIFFNFCILIFCGCKIIGIHYLKQEDKYKNYLKYRKSLLQYRLHIIDEYKNILKQMATTEEEYQDKMEGIVWKAPYLEKEPSSVLQNSIELYQEKKMNAIRCLEKRKKAWGERLQATIDQLQSENQTLQKEKQHLLDLCIEYQTNIQELEKKYTNLSSSLSE